MTRHKLIALALTILPWAAALAPAPAHARTYALNWGMTAHRANSPSMDAVAEADLYQLIDLGFATRVVRFVPILGDMWLEARVSFGDKSASAFQDLSSELSLEIVHAGARFTRDVYPRVRAFTHASAGITTGELTLTSSTARNRLFDRDRSLSWTAGAGAELSIIQARESWGNQDFAVALRAELNYFSARPLEFEAKPDHPDDDVQRIDAINAQLGGLDPSGFQIHLGLVGRF